MKRSTADLPFFKIIFSRIFPPPSTFYYFHSSPFSQPNRLSSYFQDQHLEYYLSIMN